MNNVKIYVIKKSVQSSDKYLQRVCQQLFRQQHCNVINGLSLLVLRKIGKNNCLFRIYENSNTSYDIRIQIIHETSTMFKNIDENLHNVRFIDATNIYKLKEIIVDDFIETFNLPTSVVKVEDLKQNEIVEVDWLSIIFKRKTNLLTNGRTITYSKVDEKANVLEIINHKIATEKSSFEILEKLHIEKIRQLEEWKSTIV